MPGLLPDVDPDGLLEYSVVYTDRALNHMSKRFTGVMQDILGTLKEVYHAHTAVLVPGSGTFGMEAVARQFANKEKVLIVRNGWFSYRWSQIFEMGAIPSQTIVLKARTSSPAPKSPFAPAPIDEVVTEMASKKYGSAVVMQNRKVVGIFTTVDALQAKLAAAGVNCDFHRYLAHHAFANETAVGPGRLPATQYDPVWAQQAWDRTLRFFGRHLG